MGIARSGIGWVVAKLGTLSLSFLSVVIFTRILENPTETLGTFQVFEMIASFTVLAAGLGVSQSIVKRVSEGKEVQRVLGAGLTLLVPAITAVSIILYFGREQIASIFGIPEALVVAAIVISWALQGRNFVVSSLNGFSRVGRSGAVELIDIFVRTVAQIVLVFIGFELLGLVGGAIVGTTIAFFVGLTMLPKRPRRPTRFERQRLLSFAKFSILREFASKAYRNVDTAIISLMVGNSAVSVYNVPFRIALVIEVFSSGVSTSSLPEISRHSAEGNHERVQEILTDAIVFSNIVAIPATVGMYLLAEQIIVTLFTTAFVSGSTVAILAVAIEVPSGFRGVFANAIDGMDRPDLTVRSDLLLVATNLLLDVLLVPAIGIEGAAIASLVGITLSACYLGYVFVSKLGIPLSVIEVRPLTMEVIASGVMGVVVYILRETMVLPQLWKLLLLVAVGVVTYSVTLLLISPAIRRRSWGIFRDLTDTYLDTGF